LGDNIFYGKLNFFYDALLQPDGATIFAYRVTDPERYGIVEFDSDGKAVSIEEKPENPKSEFAVPGLYVYDNSVIDVSKNLKPSGRNELEITDVNRIYMQKGELKVNQIGRGVAWLDTGTPEALLQASTFFGVIEDRQGLKVACIEEIALKKGFITKQQFIDLLNEIPKSLYRDYLTGILKYV
jgi:glucose-1-phosphate thymidylyltransferase